MNNVVPLDDLFRKRLFRVPDYQRGYSWEEQQVTEFLEDLELLGSQRYHYTGTVVLHASEARPMDEGGNTYVPVEIVDGQQRITTIVLLLDGISRSLERFSDTAKRLSQGIRTNFIVTTGINGQPLYKLSLNQDADFYFKNSVLAKQPGVEGPQITSERRLAAAKEKIAAHLSTRLNLESEAGEKWLQTLYTKVATQLRFTLYEVEDEAEVGVIFEVMNDRGKPLTDLEKVKNFLLHTSIAINIDNKLAKAVNETWAKVLRQLMAAGLVSGVDEDRLLRAHWLTHYNPQSSQWKGSRSVKDEFDLRKYKEQPKPLLNSLHCYTEGLRAACVCFCDAYQPSRSNSFQSFVGNPKLKEEVIEWSAKLARVGVIAPFLPLLLAVRERWPNDPEKYLEILKLCEAFAFRVYRLAGYRSDAGQSALFRLGYDLAHRTETFDGAVQRLKRELAYRCDNEEFINRTSENHQQVSSAYHWRGLRYFLYEYEIDLALKQGASPRVTWDELRKRDLRDTIEHILPQSIADQPTWKWRFRSTRSHQKYVHDLGNLTLTKHNSYYLNRPFQIKKGGIDAKGHCYAKSPLYVERELTQWENWSASAIKERRARLLEWARVRWAVDLSELTEEENEPEETDEPDEDSDPLLDEDEEGEDEMPR